jgi:hypothetical protein
MAARVVSAQRLAADKAWNAKLEEERLHTEVDRLRAEVLAEREAGITLGAALLEKLEIVQGRLEAVKSMVGKMGIFYHRQGCPWGACNCGTDANNFARTAVRRELGLEG